MDAVDREILRQLTADARLSLRRLGALVHLSAPAAGARLRRLEEEGVIRRYTIDVRRPPQGMRTFVDVLMKSSDHRAFAAFVSSRPDVVACHRTSGDVCYVLEVRTPDQESLARFLDALLAHANYRTHSVLSTVFTREEEPS